MSDSSRRPRHSHPRRVPEGSSGDDPRQAGLREALGARRDSVRSRRDRPAKAPLSREAILDVALDILDREGIESLTMRRLAAALDTGPASLYVYFANREDLLELLIDRVYASVEIPAPGSAPWQERAVGLLLAALEALHQHRGLAGATLGNIPLGEHQFALANTMVECLREGGLSDVQIAWFVDMSTLLVTAAAMERDLILTRIDDSADPDALRRFFETMVERMPLDRYPSMAIIPYVLAFGDIEDRLEWFLRVVLAGMTQVPAPSLPAPGPWAHLFEAMLPADQRAPAPGRASGDPRRRDR